jgi:prolyl 4-hydroxylase
MSAKTMADKALALMVQGQVEAAKAPMIRAAREGDARAQYQVGLWKIWASELERDLPAGLRLLNTAANKGITEARLTRANLLAVGAGAAESFADGVAELRKVASVNEMAQQQLDLLAAMDIDEDGRPQGAPPEPRPLSQSPEVSAFQGLFTAAECQWLIDRGANLVHPSQVIHPATGQIMLNPERTSDGGSFGPPNEDLVVRAINHRLAWASGTGVRQGEPLHMLRYLPGQEYKPHFDFLPGEPNQRRTTMLVYLNDQYVGGETVFVAGLKVRGGVGDVLMFSNLTPDGKLDGASRHAGLPVTQGVKWLATRWIRQEDFHPWGIY